jgi:lysine-specific demethylase 3
MAASLRLNGHHQGSPASDRKEDEEEDEEDLSSGDEENSSKPAPKQHRKKPLGGKGKPGPKPKGRPAGTSKSKGGSSGAAARRLATKGSESDNFTDSEKESDSSKASSRQSEVGGSSASGKKRGRKPLKTGAKAGGKGEEIGEPKLKKVKVEATNAVGSGAKSGDPFARPSISQLKKSGDSFLQDASCFEVAPKLNKCRECRWSQAQRQKQSLANIFCRFYAFRRLRYTKNGQIAQAGFCDPRQDAQAEDLKLWLPSQELSPPDMDKETAKLILRHLSSQFYTIYRYNSHCFNLKRKQYLFLVTGILEPYGTGNRFMKNQCFGSASVLCGSGSYL